MDLAPQKPPRPSSVRRSQRLLLVVRVNIAGKNALGASFSEEASTQVVNAHGALVMMKQVVSVGDRLRIRNIKTGEEIDCTVVDMGERVDHKTAVGIEFDEVSTRFWRVAFPPDDWSPKNPEAKRFSGATRARTFVKPT